MNHNKIGIESGANKWLSSRHIHLCTEPGFGVFLKRLCPVQGVGFVHHYIKLYISIYAFNDLWKSRKVFFKIPNKISFPNIERGVIRCEVKERPVWRSSKLYSKRPAYFPPQHNPCSPPNDPPEENNPFLLTCYKFSLPSVTPTIWPSYWEIYPSARNTSH